MKLAIKGKDVATEVVVFYLEYGEDTLNGETIKTVELVAKFPDKSVENVAYLSLEDDKIILVPYNGEKETLGDNAKFFKFNRNGAISRGK